MRITDFARKVCKYEGLKKEVNVAQVMEVMRVMKELIKESTPVDLYQIIRQCQK